MVSEHRSERRRQQQFGLGQHGLHFATTRRCSTTILPAGKIGLRLRKIIAFAKRTHFAPGDRQGVEGKSPSLGRRCEPHWTLCHASGIGEVSGEALAGESIGQPLSRKSFQPGLPTPYWARNNVDGRDIARSGQIQREV
jgi:hypothetical protein